MGEGGRLWVERITLTLQGEKWGDAFVMGWTVGKRGYREDVPGR